jgi:hypothetical protein
MIAPVPEKSAVIAPASSVWPALDVDPPAGTTFRAFHHGTLHVRIALPAGAKAEETRLTYGHPAIVVTLGDVRVQITYSSGGAMWGGTLAQSPPKMGTMAVDRVERDADHVTVIYRQKDGTPIVNAWSRGAEGRGEWLRDDQLDAAFRICATMRTLPPGAWRDVEPRFPPIPEGASVSHEYGVTEMVAGHFRGKVLEKACPSREEVEKNHAPSEMKLEVRAMSHGSVLVGREFQTYEGRRWEAGTTFWATRGERCCVGYIPEFFTPPSSAQIDDVARWCDLTPP